jgi:hypothetical protein
MKLVTGSELARTLGVDRSAITKAISRGVLFFKKDKFIDLDDPTTEAYISAKERRKDRQARNAKTKKEQRKKIEQSQKQESLSIKTIKPSKPANNSVPDYGDDDTDFTGVLEKNDLQCKKLKKDIEKLEIANAKARGQLISRDFVSRLFSKIYNIDVNQFLQLKDVLTTKISGVVGLDSPEDKLKITEIVNNELYKTQSHIQREIDDFLAELEKHGINDDDDPDDSEQGENEGEQGDEDSEQEGG